MCARLTLAVLLLLVTPAWAGHEAGVVGPFNVSFDMNTTMPYSVIVEKSSQGTTPDGIGFDRYNLTVQSDEYFAWIILTRYEKPMLANVTANEYIVLAALQASGANQPKLYQPMIDGHPGVLGNFRFERQYIGQAQYKEGDLVVAASYSPDGRTLENGEYRGKIDCRVISTYPWEIIRDMLYTLHIEVPKDQGMIGNNSTSS